jgi:3D (Asp-Asp-Asp) domain-containing protein
MPPLEVCTDLSLPDCKVDEKVKLPAAPAGYAWKRLNGKYTFSAYAHPSEEYYMGDLVDIPGIQGLKAKDGFLFGVDGIGMQGGGYIWRLNAERQYVPIYITYIKGDWTLGGESVTISDEWRYTESGQPVDTQQISKIRLTNARFAMVDAPKLIPNYSVAAPLRFPSGSKIYVPGLQAFGGTFEVQDCGGAFGPDSRRFDLYVGTNINDAVKFIRLNDARSNLPVYILQPISN